MNMKKNNGNRKQSIIPLKDVDLKDESSLDKIDALIRQI